jgi:hypothetical protein
MAQKISVTCIQKNISRMARFPVIISEETVGFCWLLWYGRNNAVGSHGRYGHKVDGASEGNTSISQSIINIISEVKQRNFKA